MTLFANSNICVGCWSDFIAFPPPRGLYFFFFACLLIFYWVPDIVNFTSLSAVYFYISINIPELCSGMRLTYLETDWSFQALLFRFVRWDQSSAYFRANYFPLPRQDPSGCSAQCHVSHEVFQSGWWNRHYSWTCVWQALFSWVLLVGSFPGIGNVLTGMPCTDQSFAEYSWETSAALWRFLSVRFSVSYEL